MLRLMVVLLLRLVRRLHVERVEQQRLDGLRGLRHRNRDRRTDGGGSGSSGRGRSATEIEHGGLVLVLGEPELRQTHLVEQGGLLLHERMLVLLLLVLEVVLMLLMLLLEVVRLLQMEKMVRMVLWVLFGHLKLYRAGRLTRDVIVRAEQQGALLLGGGGDLPGGPWRCDGRGPLAETIAEDV